MSDVVRPAAVTAAEIDPAQRPYLRQLHSWRRFHDGPRKRPAPLLKALAAYPDCALVAGCQRSGTTMLTRIIASSAGFRPLGLTKDDELDAALALGGYIDLPRGARYCFQTTYLNERYPEYRSMGRDQRLIWVLRNPHSVIYSMVYNWKRFALNELYAACGVEAASSPRQRRAGAPWPFGPSAIEKACLSYSVKISQVLAIRQLLPPEQLAVVEYEDIVHRPQQLLRAIFEFIGQPGDGSYASAVRSDSMAKAQRLPARAQELVEAYALPAYRKCQEAVTIRRD